jgi:hypothetical protein
MERVRSTPSIKRLGAIGDKVCENKINAAAPHPLPPTPAAVVAVVEVYAVN